MPSIVLRETFDRHLHQLMDEILVLGSMAEQAILDSVDALKRRDFKAAQRIYDNDLKINEKRYEIETQTLIQIATQQPMARDLRLLAAILELNTELERIGDYGKGIAHITILMGDTPLVMPIIDLEMMADMGLDMLRRALDAFVHQDVDAARTIPKDDDKVDALYNAFYREVLQRMIENPKIIDSANYLVWAAHNLERMSDRVTNICERTIYVATGEMRELDVSDDEARSIHNE